jgi:predicted ATP-grasp superfamily ATP-dependent carboligase
MEMRGPHRTVYTGPPGAPARAASVLVLDGELRHAIDVVRSLGARGCRVTLASSDPHAPARYSRYTDLFVLCRPAQRREDARSLDAGVQEVADLLARHPADVVVAAGLEGMRTLAYGKARLEAFAQVPAPPYDSYCTAEDKRATAELAASLDVPVPETRSPNGPGDLGVCSDLAFPVAVKARGGQGHFGYAGDAAKLRVVYGAICDEVPEQTARGEWPIVQERIPGTGHGFYALVDHGVIRNWFMHERLREVPPTGGPSSLAHSFYDGRLLEYGTRLLEELRWHGVAMIEFKRDARDGGYKLIEINPKFWGSLGLAIAAGVDFPGLLVAMALGEPPEVTPRPQLHDPVTYQWLSMDMAHSWAVRKPWLWIEPIIAGVPNDFRPSDPLPNAVLIGRRFADVVRGRRRVRSVGSASSHHRQRVDDRGSARGA